MVSRNVLVLSKESQQRDRLDRFTQSHLVSQNSVDARFVQRYQPVQTVQLVGLKLSGKRSRLSLKARVDAPRTAAVLLLKLALLLVGDRVLSTLARRLLALVIFPTNVTFYCFYRVFSVPPFPSFESMKCVKISAWRNRNFSLSSLSLSYNTKAGNALKPVGLRAYPLPVKKFLLLLGAQLFGKHLLLLAHLLELLLLLDRKSVV